MKSILKSVELKGLWGLKIYQGGVENVDSLQRQSVVAFVW